MDTQYIVEKHAGVDHWIQVERFNALYQAQQYIDRAKGLWGAAEFRIILEQSSTVRWIVPPPVTITKEVYLVFGSYFNGCDCFEHLDSVHETLESAETKQLLLEESPDKPQDTTYYVRSYKVENVKL